MTLTRDLSEIVANTRYGDLPEEALDVAAQACLDAIGVTIAGAIEPTGLGRITLDYTRALGGTGEASVIAGGFKTSAPAAAYANGTLCHALDFDPTWWPRNHPASPSLPAILAIAEAKERTGRDVLLAIVLAFEVQGRMRVASQGVVSGGTYHHPGVSGPMGAVTGAGKLLDLNAGQFCMAYGIAGSRAGSLTANAGTMTKSTHSGHAARTGVEAATLAGMGFTATDDIFGAGDFFETFYGPDTYDLNLFLMDFGKPYRMVDPGVSFKRYPAKYSTHRTIEAAVNLSNKHDLKAGEIERVEVDYPPTNLVDRPQPISGLDGKFSVQYGVAAGLLDGAVNISTYLDARRFAPDMEALLPRITATQCADIPAHFPTAWAVIRVHTTDGRVIEERCDQLKGIAGNPLTRDERLEKFHGCAGPSLGQDAADEVVGLVEGMAGLENMHRLMEIVRGAGAGGGETE